MQSIYCFGGRGDVGFVRGWDFIECDRTQVVGVQLTPNREDAYVFDQSDEHRAQLGAVLLYLREHAAVYGHVEVLGRAEP